MVGGQEDTESPIASPVRKIDFTVVLALQLAAVPVAIAQVAPDPPQNLTAAHDTSTTAFIRVVLTWKTPDNTGDSAITKACYRYRIILPDPESFGEIRCRSVADLGGVNRIVTPHLQAGSKYEFHVALHNDAGQSRWAVVYFTAGVSPTLTVNPTSVAEDAGAKVVTVTAALGSRATLTRNIVVTVSVGNGTATVGTDYTAVDDFTVTIPSGKLTGTGSFTLTPTDDDVDEDNETVEISGTATDFVSIAGTEFTITDDDTRGLTLSKEAVTVTEAPGAGRTATYTVALASQPTAAATVAVQSSAVGTATVMPASLSFSTSNWSQGQTVTVTGVDDAVDNTPDRTATISHQASGGDYASVSKDLTVTVTDDEEASAFSVADASVPEGDSGTASLSFTVSLSPAADMQTTVDWVTSKESGDTATPGTDYTAGSGTLTFAKGDTSKTATVTVTGDQVDEANETLTLTLSNATGDAEISSGGASATGTITDDDTRGLTLSKEAVTVTEAPGAGRTATYTVALASQPTAAATVAVQSSAVGTATVMPASLSFSTSNWSQGQTVTVTGVDDTVDNTPDRTATISHQASGGDYASVSKNLTVTVTDDEEASAFSVADASVTEGDSGTASLSFTVSLSPAADMQTTVDWATSKESTDTATPGTDYTAGSGTLTFAKGDTSKTATVTVTGDQVDEANETLTLTLSNQTSGLTLGTSTATGTITDDDTKGLALSKTGVTVTEASGTGRTATYTVALASQPTAAVTVAVSSSAETAATVMPASLSFTTTNWNSAKTVTVTGVDDAVDNTPDRTATISHQASGGDYASVSKDLTVTVTDDEGASAFSVADASVNEGDSGTASLSFTVSLSPAADMQTTVDWATSKESGDTATPGTDYTAGSGTLTFAKGDTSKTATVTVTGDQVDEDNETLTLTLSNQTSGLTLGTSTATGTITDDDTKGVTLSKGSVTVTEAPGAGRTATYTVALASQPTAAVTVAVSSSAETAATVMPASLSFTTTNWNSAKTVTVTGVDDSVDNTPDRTATISHQASGGDYASVSKDLTVTVTDDEGPSAFSVAAASVTEGDSGTASLSFTVSLSPAADMQTTVDWATSKESADTATPGTDYTAGSGTLTFAKGDTSKTVTVTVTGDQVDEDNETLTLTLSNQTSGLTLGTSTATGTITDDDTKGLALSKTGVTVTEAPGAGRTATYTVALASQPTAAVTVAVSSSAETAATVMPASLSFTTTNWNSAKTVTVTGVDDSVDNTPDRTATISHQASGGDYASVSKDLTVTVTDDEGPSAFSVAAASVTEGDSGTASLSFTVSLSPAADMQTTVDWATSKESADTATPGTDYTAGSGTLTFAKGDTSKTATVTVTGDQVDEDNETLTLTLSNQTSGLTLGTSTATGTITDDDTKGLALSKTGVTVTEASGAGRTATYTVALASQPTAAVTVAVASGAATAATVRPLSLSFSTSNWSQGQTVTVTGVDDDVDNTPDRTATISHRASGGDYASISKDLTVTVTDDDGTSAFSVADASVNEGDSGTASLSFTVSLSPAADMATTVAWATSDGTATAGADYTMGSGTLSFSAGDTSKTATVTVTGDQVDEDNETLKVTLSNASGGPTISDNEATGTITDDDTKGVTLSKGSVTVTEASGTGRTATYTVALASQPTAAVTVAVSSSAETAATVMPASLSFTTTNWNSAKTVTVTGVDDDVDNTPDRTATISHQASGGDYASISKDLTVTVTDDEGASAFSVADASVNEGDSGTASLSFTVSLSPAADMQTTVDWATSKESGDTATPGTDYTAGSGTLTFAKGDTSKTATVTVTGDQVDEDNETLTLTLSNQTSGLTLGTSTATGTITDDDTKGVTLSKTGVTVTEASGAGRTATYTVALASQPTAAVTVAVQSSAVGTATVMPASLSFTTTNWNSAKTVTVTGVDDDVDNTPDRTATISHQASGGDYASISKDLTVTVTDDEGASAFSVADASVNEGDSGTASLSFTVSLSPPADMQTTVDWATSKESADTATPGTDYTAGSGTLTFGAGDISKTATVTVTGDQVDEDNETLTLTLSNQTSGLTLGTSTATGTITDDDTKGLALSKTGVTVTEASGAGRTATYTVALASQPTAAVTVAVSSSAGTAATVMPASLSFTTTNWNSAKTVTVTGVDDAVDNTPDRTATISHQASGGDYASVSKDLTVTVTDDEEASAFSVAAASVTEGDSGTASLSFTVSLSPAADMQTTVDWATSKESGDTATPGTDYTAGSGTLTFAKGDTSKTATVTVTGDQVDEANETLTLTLSNQTSGLTLGTSTATGTITDDDTKGLALSKTGVTVTEAPGAGRTATYTVALASQPTAAVTVAVSSSAETAATVMPASLSFTTTNWNSAKTVTVTGVDDAVDNTPDRTATISHQASGGDYASVSKDLTVTVTDDEGASAFSVADASVTEGDSGTASLSFTVSLSPAADMQTTVDWATSKESGDTATPGTDYTAGSGTLTFAKGDTSKTATVTVTGDQVDEDNETLTLTLSNQTSGLTLGTSTATGTITDDDTKGVTLSKGSVTVTEAAGTGRTATYTVALASRPTAAVTVAVSSSAETAATVMPASLSFTTTNWNSAKTVTVTGVDDSVDNTPDRTATISHQASGGDYASVSKDLTVTVTDDEGASTALNLAVNPSSVGEGAGATSVAVTASLNGAARSSATTVTVRRTGGTATSGTDYAAISNFTVTIAAGQTSGTATLSFVPTDDALAEGAETVILTGSASGLTAGTATLTITDNEGAPTVSLSLSSTSISENGGSSTITATLSGASNQAVTVTVSATAVSPAVSSDFTLSANRTLTIAIGSTTSTGTVTITANDNEVDEPNKEVTVSGTASGASGVANPDDETLTITDDDSRGLVLSKDSVTVTEAAGAGHTATYTVALASQPTAAVTVLVSSADENAATVSSASLNFSTMNWKTGQTVTVTGVDDDVHNMPDRTTTISHTSSGGDYGSESGEVAVTVTDDEDTPAPTIITLSVQPATVVEGAGATTVRVTAALQGSATLVAASTVTVSVGSGTATSGTDFQAVSDFTITIAAGAESETATFTLTPIDDSMDEGDEKISVTGASVGLTVTGTEITITDDDGGGTPNRLPTVLVSCAPCVVGPGGETELTATASDPDGDPLTYAWSAAEGSLTGPTDETLARWRAPDREGRYTVRVEVSDGLGGTAAATVTIEVVVENRPPVLGQTSYAFELYENLAGPVQMGRVIAEDPEGEEVTCEMATGDRSRFAVGARDGMVTYVGAGEDYETEPNRYELTVRVLDEEGGEVSARVTVTVTNVNEAPVAADDTARTDEDRAVMIDVLANDTDPDGDRLEVAAVSAASHGTARVAEGGSGVMYTPAPDYHGTDGFQYTVEDTGGETATAMVEVTVVAVNEAPVAADDTARTDEDRAVMIDVLANDTDPDGDGLEVTAVSAASHGTARVAEGGSGVMYTPAPDYHGTDGFQYTVADAGGETATGMVEVTVMAVNDAPVAVGTIPDQVLRLGTEATLDLTPYFTDPDGDLLRYEAISADEGVVRVQVADSLVTMIPMAVGAANVTATARDREGASATQNIAVRVRNDLSRRARALELSLAALARTLATDAVEMIDRRFQVSGSSESRVTLAGHPFSSNLDRRRSLGRRLTGSPLGAGIGALDSGSWIDQDGFGQTGSFDRPTGGGLERRPLTVRDLLLQSSFQVELDGNSGSTAEDMRASGPVVGPAAWTLWGRGSMNGFSGRPEEGFSMDGGVVSGFLGVDYRWRENLLAGLAVSRSQGTLDYEGAAAGKGEVKLGLTSVYPYLRWSPGSKLGVWGLLGFGPGRARLSDSEVSGLETEVGMWMAAAGVRRELASGRSANLALKADAFAVEMESNAQTDLPAVEAEAQRFRLALEGRTDWELSGDSRLTPRLELGARLDGGDAENGVGGELGGGLAYRNVRLGLNVEARGRVLLAHREEDFRDWGASLTVRLGPGATGRGLALSLAPVWGNASGGVDAIWRSHRTLWEDRRLDGGRAETASWSPDYMNLELDYGLGVGRRLLTPFGALALEGAGSRRLRGGIRMEGRGAGRMHLDLFGEWAVHRSDSSRYGFGIRGAFDF